MYICLQLTKHDLSLVLCTHEKIILRVLSMRLVNKENIIHVRSVSMVLFILPCKLRLVWAIIVATFKLYLLILFLTILSLLSPSVLACLPSLTPLA